MYHVVALISDISTTVVPHSNLVDAFSVFRLYQDMECRYICQVRLCPPERSEHKEVYVWLGIDNYDLTSTHEVVDVISRYPFINGKAERS